MIAIVAVAQTKSSADRLHAFKKEAAKFNSVISLPQFELSTNEVRTTVHQTIAVGNAALDIIAALKPGKATFVNTLRALDDIGYDGWGISEQPGDQSKDPEALKDLSDRMDKVFSS